LDKGVLQDIRYYLCLALAKKKDGRMLKEVQDIIGDEHSFLKGYYYRLCGRFNDALKEFVTIIDAPYVGARSKREIVQVYVQLEEFDKALDYARNNYEENRGNQFHTQAYFNCMINSEHPDNYRVQLENLLNNLRTINSDQSNEMADIADALFCAKVENEKEIAFDKINDCVEKYPDNYYPLFALCDIALKYKDIAMLENGIDKLETLRKGKYFSNRTFNRYTAFLFALKGDENAALNLLQKELARYPKESRERIKNRIKEYSLSFTSKLSFK
jgi:lipopolysaccharide biosynthesis regulator YciM